MSTLTTVKRDIEKMSLEEQFALAQWLSDRLDEDDDWDRQMKRDAEAGKLDFLIQEADEALEKGQLREFP